MEPLFLRGKESPLIDVNSPYENRHKTKSCTIKLTCLRQFRSTCHGLPSLTVHDALYSMKCPLPLTTCPHHQSGHRWEGQQLPLGTFALEEFPRKRSSESRWWSSFSEHHVPSTQDPLLTSGRRASFYLFCLFPRLWNATHFEPGVLSIWAMHLILVMQCLKWYTSVPVLVLAPQDVIGPSKQRLYLMPVFPGTITWGSC